jgi:hypothetical protein
VYTQPKTEKTSAELPPPPAEGNGYCDCALPIVVERAERRGAAQRFCSRCDQPMPLRWRSW